MSSGIDVPSFTLKVLSDELEKSGACCFRGANTKPRGSRDSQGKKVRGASVQEDDAVLGRRPQ